MKDWPFSQSQNLAVIVTKEVMEGEPILFVFHDAEDDGWQFIGATEPSEDNGRLISLESAVALDASITDILMNMPPGWYAARSHPSEVWVVQEDEEE